VPPYEKRRPSPSNFLFLSFLFKEAMVRTQRGEVREERLPADFLHLRLPGKRRGGEKRKGGRRRTSTRDPPSSTPYEIRYWRGRRGEGGKA